MRLLITAGPTREYLDPIRFISNPSTGFLGYELARTALRRKHRVILISGPTQILPPPEAKFIPVTSALEMRDAVLTNLNHCDCVIMTAAVCDWHPAEFFREKIKRGKGRFTLRLVENPDILALARARSGDPARVFVGFSLETRGLVENSHAKLIKKRLDLVVGNLAREGKTPFGKISNDWVLIEKDKKPLWVRSATKGQIARIILDTIEALCYKLVKVAKKRRKVKYAK